MSPSSVSAGPPGLGSRRALWRAGAALAVAGLGPLALAAPAGAEATITVSAPAEGATVESSTVPVSGRAQTGSALARFKELTLALNGASQGVACGDQTVCNFTWSPTLPRNGRYELTVTAVEQTLVLEGGRSSLVRRFVVDAAPARPELEPPRVTDARTVELTWSRNTEPDMLYYAVFRKDPGAASFLPVGEVKQPASGRTVTFTDATTTLAGGDHAYQVVAVRKGGAKAETASGPSVARTASVPPPPTTTSAPGSPGPGSPGPGAPGAGPTTTVARPGSAAGVDLSGFLSSRAPATPAPPTTLLQPPDLGFQATLPFGARPPGEDLEEGDAEAVLPADRRTSPVVSLDGGRPLVPVAAGLVLLLLAMHLRLLNRRLKPVADGDLPMATGPRPAPGDDFRRGALNRPAGVPERFNGARPGPGHPADVPEGPYGARPAPRRPASAPAAPAEFRFPAEPAIAAPRAAEEAAELAAEPAAETPPAAPPPAGALAFPPTEPADTYLHDLAGDDEPIGGPEPARLYDLEDEGAWAPEPSRRPAPSPGRRPAPDGARPPGFLDADHLNPHSPVEVVDVVAPARRALVRSGPR